MKVLNGYAGVGGNRSLWTDVQVTAVELRPDLAAVYKERFPNDVVIVGDAHKYLIENYYKFDYIWLSRPCQSHSRANYWASRNATNRKKVAPDLTLYSEILFLKHWFDGLFSCENVIPYYEPLIKPTVKLGRHLVWSNFEIPEIPTVDLDIHKGKRKEWSEILGFDLSEHKINSRKDQIYRNMIHPETGLHILNCARNIITKSNTTQTSLFA